MTFGPHEVEVLFTALTTVIGFFVALWMRGIRDDVRLVVETLNSHGNRLTALETRLHTIAGEVHTLRLAHDRSKQ